MRHSSNPVSTARRPSSYRRRKYSARPFVLSILAIFTLTLLSVAARNLNRHTGLQSRAKLQPRQLALLSPDNKECRLVHDAPNQCDFVKANCPDEEAGIVSYLTLYYCRLPDLKPLTFIILTLWLSLLFSTIGIAASDFFCVNLSTISSLLGLSESMAGVTFLAFGNGSPDVFSTFAAMSTNSGSLAVGELMGAAGFITAVVAGSMALVRPFKVAKKSFVRDVGFFIVAASFSMVFLWDGKLYFWECATMVAFYVFYVVTVMFWHWWLDRRRARRQRIATMRSQYVLPGGDEEDVLEQYHDDDDDGPAGDSHTPQRGLSGDDFSALERTHEEDYLDIYDDDGEEDRERWLGELNSNMRLRPSMGERRNTQTPIRPSLVGALEFRAVLSSLKKSRNIQTAPIHLRRYSDDPTFTTAQQQNLLSTASDSASRQPYAVTRQNSDQSPGVSRPDTSLRRAGGNRARAVSTNDMDGARLDPGILQQGAVPSIDLLAPLSEDDMGSIQSHSDRPLLSPLFSLSPPTSQQGSRTTSPDPPHVRTQSSDLLAPPGAVSPGSQPQRLEVPGVAAPDPHSHPGPHHYPKLSIPGASPPSPFPPYFDRSPSSRASSRAPSLRLPPPSIYPESIFNHHEYAHPAQEEKPLKWWPYKVLPPPQVLKATLFPTLYNWKDRTIWERFLGVIAAPSVFLLTITLPVVEGERDEDADSRPTTAFSLPPSLTPVGNGASFSRSTITILEPESPASTDSAVLNGEGLSLDTTAKSKSNSNGHRKQGHSTHSTEQHHLTVHHAEPMLTSPTNPRLLQSPEQLPINNNTAPEPKQWNRWLVILQAFTAPYFIVLIFWANMSLDSPRALVKPTLYSLLVSLVLLTLILTTTSPTRPPKWRVVLCFLGFAVAISWISSIANEVVGVLKTLGVVLNMSDAILGLTIFAVGNSLGDLVADITVARLGFPVMALSACFGGPMLNILLGIGVSGCYITLKGGQHHQKKHPGHPLKMKPYHVDVSTTLVISGATLLVTLVGLLIAVPMRKWKMDKMIGWGLVILWSVSTVGNVMVEVFGYGNDR